MTDAEYLTLAEAARLLQVSPKTLWSLARAYHIPHFRVGKQYRFARTELLAWAKHQKGDMK